MPTTGSHPPSRPDTTTSQPSSQPCSNKSGSRTSSASKHKDKSPQSKHKVIMWTCICSLCISVGSDMYCKPTFTQVIKQQKFLCRYDSFPQDKYVLSTLLWWFLVHIHKFDTKFKNYWSMHTSHTNAPSPTYLRHFFAAIQYDWYEYQYVAALHLLKRYVFNI